MADVREEGDVDIEIAADVVVEPEPVNPNEAAKQALRATKKADPKPDPQADYEEGKRLFETLNNHNPELARAIWGKQMSLTDKIAELRKEVQSAEGGPA
jgi:hypothetical protein